jgi:hypothetical protein
MKTRTVRRSRLVPHEIDGEIELVLEHYDEEIPQPPRDWDQRVRTAVTVSAGLLVTVSVVWSTASIGDLLSRVVVFAAAYGAAIAFDLLWIMCSAVEWLCRYDPDRAKVARGAGIVALLVAMAAVFAHGYLAGQPVIGAVGAVVSALAKGGTMLAMTVHARPLDRKTQQWVQLRRAAMDGRLAMIPVRRELQRGQAVLDAEAAALGIARPERPDADPESPAAGPEQPRAKVLPITPGRMSIADAVRMASDCGIHEEEAVLRYVRKVADPNAKQETVARYMRAVRKVSGP